MTRFVLDVASYQGGLASADVARAGFSAINLKVSHGLTQKAVHPDLAGWVTRARAAGLAVSSFHYLDASAPGDAQAAYAYGVMSQYGLTVGCPHVVDCEANATEEILRAYVIEMTARLGRRIAIYSGDWWWTARGWTASDLTPFLWAPPDAGYLTAYPGDTSASWGVSWGGWRQQSILQYAVGPLSYPDGKAGKIDVSKSAVRDEAVWTALAEGSTVASQAYTKWKNDGSPWKYGRAIKATGDRLREHGYVVYYMGNQDHLEHEPPEDHTPFSATGWPGQSPYPYCMAMDVMPPAAGQKSKLTGKPLPSLAALAAQLRRDKIAGHPGASWLKYINHEPEGPSGPCYHDSWMPSYARRTSSDRGHIHASSRTDFATSAVADDYDLVARTLGEDDDLVTTQDEFNTLLSNALKDADIAARYRALAVSYTGGGIPAGKNVLGVFNEMYYNILAILANVAADDGDLAAIKQVIADAQAAEVARTAAQTQQLLAALAEVRPGADPVTEAELTAALRRVYGEAFDNPPTA